MLQKTDLISVMSGLRYIVSIVNVTITGNER